MANKKRKSKTQTNKAEVKKKSKDKEQESEPQSRAAIASENIATTITKVTAPTSANRRRSKRPTLTSSTANVKKKSKDKEQESEPQSHAAIASENTATCITTPTQNEVTAPMQDQVSNRFTTFSLNETQLKEHDLFYEEIKKQNFFTHKALVKYPLSEHKQGIVKWLKVLHSEPFPNCNVKNDLKGKWKVVDDVLYSNKKKENGGESLPITTYEDIYETILKVDMENSPCSNAELGFLVTKVSGNITKQMVQFYCACVSSRRIAKKREKKQEKTSEGKDRKDQEKEAKIQDLKDFMSKASAAWYVNCETCDNDTTNTTTSKDNSQNMDNDTPNTTASKDNSQNIEMTPCLVVENKNDTLDTTSKDNLVAETPVPLSKQADALKPTPPSSPTVQKGVTIHTQKAAAESDTESENTDVDKGVAAVTTSKQADALKPTPPSSPTVLKGVTIHTQVAQHTEIATGPNPVHINDTLNTTSSKDNSRNMQMTPALFVVNKNDTLDTTSKDNLVAQTPDPLSKTCPQPGAILERFRSTCKESNSQLQELKCDYFRTFHGLYNSDSMNICWMNTLAIIMFYQLPKCVLHTLKTSWDRNYPPAQDICAKKIDEFTAHAYDLITILLTKDRNADKSLGNTNDAKLCSCDQLVTTFLDINKERVNNVYSVDEETLRNDNYMEQGVEQDICELATTENLLGQFDQLDPTTKHYSVPKYMTIYETDKMDKFHVEENDGLLKFCHKSNVEWIKGFEMYKKKTYDEVHSEYLSEKTKRKRSKGLPNNKKWNVKLRDKENNFVLEVTPKQIVTWVFGSADTETYVNLPMDVKKELKSDLSDEMNAKIDQGDYDSVGTFKKYLCIQCFPHILCFQMVGTFHDDVMSGHDKKEHKYCVYSQQYSVKDHDEIVEIYDNTTNPTKQAKYKVCGMIMRLHKGIECEPEGHYIAVVRTRCDEETDERWMFHDDHHSTREIKDINNIDEDEDYMPVIVFMRKLGVKNV